MKLIVGLGNPGRKYEGTRHNAGFLVVDAFSEIVKADIDKADFKGVFTSFDFEGERIFLFKPHTFMNLSGEAVVAITNFFKIDMQDVIVIYDDMDLSPGNIRLKPNGGSGGQKGIQNIIDLTGTSNLKRIRIGIGKPEFNGVDHVLQKPGAGELILFENGIKAGVNALKDILSDGFEFAMKKYNQKESNNDK